MPVNGNLCSTGCELLYMRFRPRGGRADGLAKNVLIAITNIQCSSEGGDGGDDTINEGVNLRNRPDYSIA